METRAASTLLQDPVNFKINGKTYKIGSLYMGTLIFMGKYIALLDFDRSRLTTDPINSAMSTMSTNAPLMARIVATAILNNKLKIRLFGSILSKKLLWTLDPNSLRKLVEIIISQSNVVDFITSIVFLQGSNVLSQKETSPSGTGEKIAPGV